MPCFYSTNVSYQCIFYQHVQCIDTCRESLNSRIGTQFVQLSFLLSMYFPTSSMLLQFLIEVFKVNETFKVDGEIAYLATPCED